MRHAHRFQSLALAATPFFLAALTILGVTRGGMAFSAALALSALAVAAIAFTLRPRDLFLLWLLAAPFLQSSVADSRLGHVLRITLYSAPPLLFLMWTLVQRRHARGSVVDVMPALYLGFVSISAALSPTPPSSTQAYSIVGMGVIVYYFLAFGKLGESLEVAVARVLLITAPIAALIVELSTASGRSGSAQTTAAGYPARATGPLGDPVLLGMFLGSALAVAVAVLAWKGPSSLRRLSVATVILVPPAIFLTYTRAPMLAALAVVSLLLLTRARTRWGGILAAAVIAVVTLAAWGSITSTSLYKTRFSNTSNIDGRLLIDHWSVILAKRRPLAGWGYGSFDYVKNTANLSSGSIPRSAGIVYTSHNTYLTILVELGAVGFVLFLLPWAATAWSAIRSLGRAGPDRWATVAFLGVLGIWGVNAASVDMRFFSLAMVLAWMSVGLLRRQVLDRAGAAAESGHIRAASRARSVASE